MASGDYDPNEVKSQHLEGADQRLHAKQELLEDNTMSGFERQMAVGAHRLNTK